MFLSASFNRARVGAATLCALAALAGGRGAALAQTAAPPSTASDDTLALLAPAPLSTKNPLLKPRREYQGMRLGDWMLDPSITVGGAYDDNLGWSVSRPVRTAGLRVAPSVSALRESEGHKIVVFGDADAKLYPSYSRANSIDGAAGLNYEWSPARDLTFKASGKYSHNSLVIGSGQVQTPNGLLRLVSPLVHDRFQGAFAVQKTFGRAFVGLSYESAKTIYAPLDTSSGSQSQSYRDSWVNRVTARAGAWVAPVFYAFGEASGNMRDYTDSRYQSKGYRAIAGLGSDRISLFRGEIFAGAQQQNYHGATRSSATSPVFGGKLYWYPLRDLAVRASLDQSFSDSSLPSAINPLGAPARVTNAELAVQHQVLRDLYVVWRLAYEADRFIKSPRADDVWRTGGGLAYSATRNIDVIVDYEFSKASSNDATARYRRNAANAGVKYRF